MTWQLSWWLVRILGVFEKLFQNVQNAFKNSGIFSNEIKIYISKLKSIYPNSVRFSKKYSKNILKAGITV